MPKTKSKSPQPPRVESIAFVSLGCPKNLVDSEKMLGLLAEDGIAITPSHQDADAIIINTCGFLEASKTESLEVIREAVELKHQAAKQGQQKRIVVAGCLVQRHRALLLNEVPEIDALVGVFDRENIVKAVRGRGGEYDPVTPESGLGHFHPVTSFISKPTKSDIGQGYLESDRARLRLTPRHYAYLRVSEGCNQGCTFCTIPSIRGRMRSKPLPDILAEAEELIADGAVELNLIGQDTTSYGEDIGYNLPSEGLSGMLRALDKHVAKISPSTWLRLMYAYPSCFTDDMIKTLADCPRLVKYIDMPLQHINDEILFAMRRKVTRKQTETLLEKLRNWVPNLTLRTTLITAFPGETDAQHKELLQFVKNFQFDCLGVFEYSPEPGTPAGRLWDEKKIDPQTSAARKEELMLAQQQIVLKKNQALVGKTLKVLIDETHPTKKTAVARHQGQAPDIDGRVLLAKCKDALAVPGEIIEAAIHDFNYYDLLAVPVPKPQSLPIRGAATTLRQKKMSLPVLGAITTSIESRSKRG